MTVTAVTGLGLGLALGGSLLLLVAAVAGWRPVLGRGGRRSPQAEVLWGRGGRRRAAVAVAVGVGALVLTRWPVAAGAAVGVIYLWPTMFGGARAGAAQLERLEALATWTESLRDSIAGSAGLEAALRHSVQAAPAVLVPGLQRLDGRLRAQIPLPQALTAFAEEFEDASADLVVAALVLNSRLRGPELGATLSALATAAREEVEMRRKVEEGRKSLRRNALIILSVTGLIAGGLAVFSRDYVAPYSTPGGQLVLAVVLGVFATGLVWIRQAVNVRPPERFLVGADQVDQALRSTTEPGAGQ